MDVQAAVARSDRLWIFVIPSKLVILVWLSALTFWQICAPLHHGQGLAYSVVWLLFSFAVIGIISRLATIETSWLAFCAFTFCLGRGLGSSLYLLIAISVFFWLIWFVGFFLRFIVLVWKTPLTWLTFSFQPVLVLTIVNDYWLLNHFVQFFRLVGLNYSILNRILQVLIVSCREGLIFPFRLCRNLLELDCVCCCWLSLL